MIPRVLGPGLNKAGKFPTVLSHSESMLAKAEDVKATIKFQMKKVRYQFGCYVIAIMGGSMAAQGSRCFLYLVLCSMPDRRITRCCCFTTVIGSIR